MKQAGTHRRGFTLVEILIVVLIIGIVLGIAVPVWFKARDNSQRRACVQQLRAIDGAVQQYAMDNRLSATATPPAMTDLVGATLYLKHEPDCPTGGTYAMGATVDDYPTCSLATDGHEL